MPPKLEINEIQLELKCAISYFVIIFGKELYFAKHINEAIENCTSESTDEYLSHRERHRK